MTFVSVLPVPVLSFFMMCMNIIIIICTSNNFPIPYKHIIKETKVFEWYDKNTLVLWANWQEVNFRHVGSCQVAVHYALSWYFIICQWVSSVRAHTHLTLKLLLVVEILCLSPTYAVQLPQNTHIKRSEHKFDEYDRILFYSLQIVCLDMAYWLIDFSGNSALLERGDRFQDFHLYMISYF
jgi:hypothetical protein